MKWILGTHDAVCVHVTCTVVTVHAICEGLHNQDKILNKYTDTEIKIKFKHSNKYNLVNYDTKV